MARAWPTQCSTNFHVDRVGALQALAALAPRQTSAVGPGDTIALDTRTATAFNAVEMRPPDGQNLAPGTHHLLLSLLSISPEVAEVFAEQSITVQTVRETTRRISG